MFTLLHLNNSFPSNSVFDLLFKSLICYQLDQTVFSPVRSDAEFSKLNSKSFSYIVLFPYLIRPFHKIFFRLKIQTFFNFLTAKLDLSVFDMVHAHTLYTDGFLAFQIFQKFQIPYILSIRKTDLSIFEKYRPDLRIRRNLVLKNAKAIIFLTPVYKDRYFELLSSDVLKIVKPKAYIISNPLSSFWLENRVDFSFRNNRSLSVLYVGNNTKNKNLKSLIEAVLLLSKDIELDLNIVGVSSSESLNDFKNVHYLGYFSDLDSLKEAYQRADIFCVPSFNETFGMVYLEALSQGVPVLYSDNEGISGLFSQNFAKSIDPHSVDSIAAGILHFKSMIDRRIPFDSNEVLMQFSESIISEKLSQLYTV